MEEIVTEADGIDSIPSIEDIPDTKILKLTEKEYEISKKHKEIESTIGRNMSHVTVLAIFTALAYTLRCNIMVLYMRTFYDNTSLISIIVYISCLFAAFNSLGQSFVADHWKFDILIVFCAVLDIILFSFEAGAWSFTVISVCYILSGQPLASLVTGYLARMLPVTQSKRAISLYYQLFVLAYIAGPSIGGMSHFFIFVSIFF